MFGSYREWLRQQNKNVSNTVQVAAANAGPVTLVTNSGPKYVTYVQRISVHILTTAAQTGTFQDTNGTPVKIDGIPTSAAVGPELDYDYLDEGVPLTAGKDLVLALSGAGYALLVAVEAYAKIPLGTVCVPSDL